MSKRPCSSCSMVFFWTKLLYSTLSFALRRTHLPYNTSRLTFLMTNRPCTTCACVFLGSKLPHNSVSLVSLRQRYLTIVCPLCALRTVYCSAVAKETNVQAMQGNIVQLGTADKAMSSSVVLRTIYQQVMWGVGSLKSTNGAYCT